MKALDRKRIQPRATRKAFTGHRRRTRISQSRATPRTTVSRAIGATAGDAHGSTTLPRSQTRDLLLALFLLVLSGVAWGACTVHFYATPGAAHRQVSASLK